MNERIPAEVFPPGEFLADEIEARGWTQRELASMLGVPEQDVTMLISGKIGVSPEMANALGKVFDVSPYLFINLQRAFDLARASRRQNSN